MTHDDAERALAAARRVFAGSLAVDELHDEALGKIRLRPDQIATASVVLRALRSRRGALLAERVGSGKTYVALAVASCWQRVIIAAPSALLAMWHDALQRSAIHAQLLSYETLSRRRYTDSDADLLIFDEAHHLRNPHTHRYAAAAALCARASVLLLSATPVQNRLDDVRAQLALFVGASAFGMTEQALAQFIVRGAKESPPLQLPRLSGPHRVSVEAVDDPLDEILALPPPIAPLDGGHGGALVAHMLVQQWASSHGALVAALRRRLARALALEHALAGGRYPTRAELASWCYADGVVQLGFAELLVERSVPAAELLRGIAEQRQALGVLLRRLERMPDPDIARADALRRLRARHAGERIIAFSQFAETILALGRLCLRDSGVAYLTARGARVAGGALGRREVLSQFQEECSRPSAAERIELLLATDVLSEGLNLQRASVVVHLDLPWNPARLEQRVGRARRWGSSHEIVTVYALAPPVSSGRWLDIEARLDAKLRVAARAVGVDQQLVPRRGGECPAIAADTALPEAAAGVRDLLARWRAPEAQQARAPNEAPLIAAVASPISGYVAALACPGELVIVADAGSGPVSHPRIVRVALAQLRAESVAIAPDARRVGAALASIARWWADYRSTRAVNLATGVAVRRRRAALRRIDNILRAAPRHRRAELSALAGTARDVLAMPLSAGAELRLHQLTGDDDESWMRSVAGMASAPLPRAPLAHTAGAAAQAPLVALVLLDDSGAASLDRGV